MKKTSCTQGSLLDMPTPEKKTPAMPDMKKSMSRLERLMEELCPNGVEYKTIGDICEISRGKVISKDYIRDNKGIYPVYSSQTENDGILGTISTYMYDGEYLTWTTDGANAGSIFYRLGKFNITNVCGLLKILNDDIITKYIYYILEYKAKEYVNSGMGNPKLMSHMVAKIKIPVPPLPVQEEIVRILDTFSELTSELTSELNKRKQQYEYYQYILFNKNWKLYPIGTVCNVQSGGTPSKNKKEYWSDGTIKWLGSSVCKNTKCVTEITGYITNQGLKESSSKLQKSGTTLIALVGATIGKVSFLLFDAAINQNIAAIKSKNISILNDSFLFYACRMLYHKFIKLTNDNFGMANLTFIKKLKIPVPPLEEQERIVSILDRFDALCNDLSSGLPAEIEARKKQYEYYRDKLLTFREAK